MMMMIISTVSIVVIIFASLVSSSSCPMNLDFVLSLSWDSSACQISEERAELNGGHGASSLCCQTLTSLYGIGFAQNLKKTDLFRLPDLNTSVSCLSDFQERLNSLSLPSYLTASCFEPAHFVKGADVCANIQTRQDWLALVGPSTALDSACEPDLTDLTSCDACVQAGFKVHSQLLTFDRESSHARGCFYYTVLYAAGVVNKLGPESIGAVSCIFGLPISSNSKSDNIGKLTLVFGPVGAASAVFVVSLLVVAYLGWRRLRKKKKRSHEDVGLETEMDDQVSWLHWRPKRGLIWFKIKDLEQATNYFSPNNSIGRGQTGIVYKGTLTDGTVVAVKKIIESDSQGGEFLNEVEIIGNLKHRNLVPLRGCCVSNRNQNYLGETQRYLVYDYMPNGSLNEHLFSPQGHVGKGRRPLTWPERKNIILDVAKGLAYLHYGVKPAIYHRDIKATNILLDVDMRARVADFGLARQIRESDTYLPTRVAGTHGYLAPEYALYGQLTEKSDVYSFGMVILEVLTGRKALDLPSSSSESSRTILLTDWVWSLVKEGRIREAFDPSLLRNAEPGSRSPQGTTMERFLMVGILCAHLMVALRPNILDAIKMLEGDIEVPAISDRPVYAKQSSFHSLYTSTSNEIRASSLL